MYAAGFIYIIIHLQDIIVNPHDILKYMQSIFISIASCKELFLVQTIKSAMANASNPDDVYFGICNMVIDEEDFLDDPIFKLSNINVVETKHSSPLGIGIGRMLSSLMADREHKYHLQVDAHTLFVKGWDDILKKQYQELLEFCEKPIISTSPKEWYHTENEEIFINSPKDIISLENFNANEKNPTLIFSNNKNALTESMRHQNLKNNIVGFVEGCDAKWKEEENFKEHGLMFGSFAFYDFSFLNELINDPSVCWAGDQTNLSVRAGTRGYRMFTVKKATVFTKNKFDDNRKLLYGYDWRRSQPSKVHQYLNAKAKKQLIKILSGEYIGFWGASDKESMDKYESSLGFKFLDNFADEGD
jgi:hypothetical protein